MIPGQGICDNIWWIGFESRDILSHSTTSATYEASLACDVTVTVPLNPGERIKIIFDYFEVEGPDNNGACTDYLQFFYDYKREKQITEKLCGFQVPSDLDVMSGRFTLYFTSDAQFQAGGFRFNYSVFPLEDGQTISRGGSTTTTPGTSAANIIDVTIATFSNILIVVSVMFITSSYLN